jgi:hypothetical protein
MPHTEIELMAPDPEREAYNRRQFLKISGLSGAALFAAGLFPSEVLGKQLSTYSTSADQDPSSGLSYSASVMEKGVNLPYLVGSSLSYAAESNVESVVVWAQGWDAEEPTQGDYVADDTNLQIGQDVAATNKKMYVAIPSQLPDWAEIAENHAPKERGLNSPWGKYFMRKIEEFPDASAYIFCNEPNFQYFKDPHSAKHVAEMMVTASKLMKNAGLEDKLLLGPAIADGVPDKGIAYMTKFIKEIKDTRYKFEVPAGIAYHGYDGVKHNDVTGVAQVSNLSQDYWPGLIKSIYLTELGDKFYTTKTRIPDVFKYVEKPSLAIQEHWQKNNVIQHYLKCQAMGNIALWANYTYQDTQLGGGGFMSGLIRYSGVPHPVFQEWQKL